MQETQETWFGSLGWEDPLEEEMAPQSCILAWEIPWTEEPGGLQSIGWQRTGHNRATEHKHTHTHTQRHAHTHARTHIWLRLKVTCELGDFHPVEI